MNKFAAIFISIFILFAISPTFAIKSDDTVRTNNMPKTMDEYYEEAQKRANEKLNIPEPDFEKDDKIIDLPPPKIEIKKYNYPPGSVEINLQKLKKDCKVKSLGVASPDASLLTYSNVFYYPTSKTAGSELYLMQLDKNINVHDRLKKVHVNQGKKVIYRTGMDSLKNNVQKTLTVLDWSADGMKIAFKEKISFSEDGLWQTNLFVYDLDSQSVRELTEIREAIKYHWRNQGLDLNLYRWDIFPMGWDELNPDRIIVFAYAYTGERPKYLGAWSIDRFGNRSMLLSLTSSNFKIAQNGLALKLIAD